MPQDDPPKGKKISLSTPEGRKQFQDWQSRNPRHGRIEAAHFDQRSPWVGHPETMAYVNNPILRAMVFQDPAELVGRPGESGGDYELAAAALLLMGLPRGAIRRLLRKEGEAISGKALVRHIREGNPIETAYLATADADIRSTLRHPARVDDALRQLEEETREVGWMLTQADAQQWKDIPEAFSDLDLMKASPDPTARAVAWNREQAAARRAREAEVLAPPPTPVDTRPTPGPSELRRLEDEAKDMYLEDFWRKKYRPKTDTFWDEFVATTARNRTTPHLAPITWRESLQEAGYSVPYPVLRDLEQISTALVATDRLKQSEIAKALDMYSSKLKHLDRWRTIQ